MKQIFKITETVFRSGVEFSSDVYEFNSKNERDERLNYLLNEWRSHPDYTVEKIYGKWHVNNNKWLYVYEK